jgi:hypothetical protein
MNIQGAYYTFDSAVNVGSIVQIVQGQDNFVMLANETSEFENTFTLNNTIRLTGLYKEYTYFATKIAVGTLEITCFQNGTLLWINTISTFSTKTEAMIVTPTGVYFNIQGCGGRWLVGSEVIITTSDPYTTIIQLDLLTGRLIEYGYYRNIENSKLTLDTSTDFLYLYGYTNGPSYFETNVEPMINIPGLYSFLIQLGAIMNPIQIIYTENVVTTFSSVSSGINTSTYIDTTNNVVLSTLNLEEQTKWEVTLGTTSTISVLNLIIGAGYIALFLLKNGTDYTIDIYETVQTTVTITPSISTPINFGSMELDQSCFSINVDAILYLYVTTIDPINFQSYLSEYIGVSGQFVWTTLIPFRPLHLSCSENNTLVSYDKLSHRFTIKWPYTLGVVSELLWPIEANPCGANAYLKPSDCCGQPGTCVPVPASSPPYEITSVVKVDFLITEAFYNNPNITVPIIPGQEYYITSTGKLTLDSIGNDFFGTALDSKRIYMVRNGARI